MPETEDITYVAATVFSVVWIGYTFFILYEYLKEMANHRRGEIYPAHVPESRNTDHQFRRMLLFNLLSAYTDFLSLSALAVAVIKPPRGGHRCRRTKYPEWINWIIEICQDIQLWFKSPDGNQFLFMMCVGMGLFLFCHRMMMFYHYGVRVKPLRTSSTGRRHWLFGGARAWWSGGGNYHQACDGVVARMLLRRKKMQLLFDGFLLSIVRFLVESGACSHKCWCHGIHEVCHPHGLSFDPRVACGSSTQYLYVFLATLALCGWYVWVTIKILRQQNHYPLTAETGLGDRKAPEDFFCPFYLIALFQVKILLGGVAALTPSPYVVLPMVTICAIALVVQTLVMPPCRFKLVNWARTACFTLVVLNVMLITWLSDGEW